MTVAKGYFESGEWWNLRPAQDLLAEQPGVDDARRFVAAARTTTGAWTVVYLPVGQSIRLQPGVATGMSARWFDPRRGHWIGARAADEDEGGQLFFAPGAADWILDLRR